MWLRWFSTLALLLFVDALGDGRDAVAGDFVCRSASPARASRKAPPFPAFTPHLGMTVGDALSHGESPPERLLDLESPDALCVEPGDAADALALAGYAAKPTGPRARRIRPRAHAVQTRFGIQQLQVTRGPERVLFPAVWAAGTTPPAAAAALASGERFACYRVAKRGRSPVRSVRVPIMSTDDTLPETLELLRPTRLCLPADVNGDDRGAVLRDEGLLCFAARAADRPRLLRQLVALRTVLDPAVLKATASFELCVPAQEPDATLPTPVPTTPGGPTPVPTPTIANPEPTATPDGPPGEPTLVSVEIRPRRAGLKPGESTTLTARGTFSDDSTRDVTEEMKWLCDYGSDYICHASNQAGERGRITARSLITPYGSVSVVDPANDQVLDSIQVDVSLSPVPLIVYPYYNVIRQFDYDYLTALRLENGGYQNVTQEVVWSSNDPSIAVAANPAGERSRIDGAGPGLTTVIATDPLTGAVSDPVTFDVFGPLNNLEVRAFGAGTSPLGATILDVGDVAAAAAWGYFDYGFTFEWLRGGVMLSSSVPAVASLAPRDISVPRTTGFFLQANAPGVATVSAYDPLSGLGSTDHGCDLQVTVRNPAVLLRLQPAQREIGLDEVIHLTALGVAVDGTTRNLTQRVTYTSSNPAVVLPIPDAYLNDRSRMLAVGPGVATITAISDPVFNKPQIATTATTVATITVRNERVSRIVVEPSRLATVPHTRPRFVARGYYPSGKSNVVTESVSWTSSDPDVAQQSGYVRSRLDVFDVGTATITATLASGVSSHDTGDDGTLAVRKPVKLSVVPTSTTLTVGASVSITALAQLSSGETIDLMDRDITPDPRWAPVFFRTSAPNVARSTGTCRAGDYLYPTQPVVAVAPGTATISATSWATDPPTESNAAGNATITVVP
jgi:hypothetical protein